MVLKLSTFFKKNILNFFLILVTNSSPGADNESCAGTSQTSTESSLKRSKISGTEDGNGSDEDDVDFYIVHQNQPVLMSVFREPDTEIEKLIVVATLPGGATDVEFSLLGSGPGTSLARISYSWPAISFNIDAIFEKQVKAAKLPSCHPKILALKKELHSRRETIDDTPTGVMELTLPISVQTSSDSITRLGGIKGDSLLSIVELKAYQSAYTVKQTERKITFEEL